MITTQQGTADDFKRYLGKDNLPSAWCVNDPEGVVIVEDGECIAVAFTTIDQFDRIWLWFSQKRALSAIRLYRNGIRLLAGLKAHGRSVHIFVDPSEPTAETWVRRSGFHPLCETTHPSGARRIVWRKD